MISLINLVRKGIAKDYRFIAIDENNRAYGSKFEPIIVDDLLWCFSGPGSECFYLGQYELTCDYKHAVLDLELIQSKGIY